MAGKFVWSCSLDQPMLSNDSHKLSQKLEQDMLLKVEMNISMPMTLHQLLVQSQPNRSLLYDLSFYRLIRYNNFQPSKIITSLLSLIS